MNSALDIKVQTQRLERQAKRCLSATSIKRKAFQNFYKTHGYLPNLVQPQTFSEKLLFRKLQQDIWLEKQADLVDKNSVRKFIENQVGKRYLIPQLGYINDAKNFNFEQYTPPIILKATHGSGWNLIIRDEEEFKTENIRNLISAWLSCNYSDSFTGESQYRKVSPGVVIEPLLTDDKGEVPVDYKFHCFNQGEKIIIQTDIGRFNNHTRDFYNENWDLLELNLKHGPSQNTLSRPTHLIEMLQVARKLAKNFDYIRVDLYSLKSNIFFGELTLVPGNACEKVSPAAWDTKLGEYWQMQRHTTDSYGYCNILSNWIHSIRARLVS